MRPLRPRLRAPEIVGFVLLACACGYAARAPKGGGSSDVTSEARNAASVGREPNDGAAAPDPFASVERYAADHAPGMHTGTRRVSAGERIEIVRAGRHDTCVRVAFEADAPVHARLIDATGDVLARTSAATLEGMLGELGAVCIRKGEALDVDADGSPVRVRWVAMVSEPTED